MKRTAPTPLNSPKRFGSSLYAQTAACWLSCVQELLNPGDTELSANKLDKFLRCKPTRFWSFSEIKDSQSFLRKYFVFGFLKGACNQEAMWSMGRSLSWELDGNRLSFQPGKLILLNPEVSIDVFV